MYRFSLYRLIARPKNEIESLFNVHKGFFFKKLIQSQPKGEVRKGVTWVIASNFRSLEQTNGIHFEFGRISEKEKNAFDNEHNLFISRRDEEVEYTDCFFFPESQLLAVRNGKGITVKPETISRYLCRVLHQADSDVLTAEEKVVLTGHVFNALPVLNPEPFFQRLVTSYKVSKFDVTFGYPNPFDFQAGIQRPMQEFQAAAAASHSRLTVKNKNGLNVESLEDVSRGASVLDGNVEAKIHSSEEDVRGTTITLKGESESAHLDVDEETFEDRIESVGRDLVALFEQVAPEQ